MFAVLNLTGYYKNDKSKGNDAMDKIIRFGIAIGLVALIAGCGVRGPLEPVSASKDEKGAKTATSESKEKKHDSFILDGLLR